MLMCLASSYFYAWLAAFGHEGTLKEEMFTHKFEFGIEIFFVLSMAKNFLTNYTPDGSYHPVNRFIDIASRYIKSGFLMDLIPLLPITILIDIDKAEQFKLFYILKILRL